MVYTKNENSCYFIDVMSVKLFHLCNIYCRDKCIISPILGLIVSSIVPVYGQYKAAIQDVLYRLQYIDCKVRHSADTLSVRQEADS